MSRAEELAEGAEVFPNMLDEGKSTIGKVELLRRFFSMPKQDWHSIKEVLA